MSDAPVPSDRAGWRAAPHRVKRIAGDGNFAILLPIDRFKQLLTFALQQPDPLLRAADTHGNFRSSGFGAALAFYVSPVRERLAPMMTAAEIANTSAEFHRDFFAVFLSGPCMVTDLKTRLGPKFERDRTTAAMPGPTGPGVSAPGGSSLVVSRGARDPAAAWALVRDLSDPAVQARFNALASDLPARPSAWTCTGLDRDRLMQPVSAQLSRARRVQGARVGTHRRRDAARGRGRGPRYADNRGRCGGNRCARRPVARNEALDRR